MKMSGLGWLAWVLVIIGGLNWGLVGLFKFNLVENIFSGAPTILRIVYDLVGLGALLMLFGVGRKSS